MMKPNLTIKTGTAESQNLSSSPPETSEKGKEKPRSPSATEGVLSELKGHPASPTTGARRLFKIANKDPFSTVKPSLGPKSSSHPNVPFEEGGGYLVDTEKKRNLEPEEVRIKNGNSLQIYEDRKSKGLKVKEPKLVDENTMVTEFKAGTEYHPEGGIHSNYELQDSGGYIRTTAEVPPGHTLRTGRYGPFDSKSTFDHKPINAKGRATRVENPKLPPNKSDSRSPSPETAHRLMRHLHKDPEQMITQINSGKPYKDIDEAMRNLATGGGNEASTSTSSSKAGGEKSA
ncbi:MAG: hypothetical protein ON057_000416 [Glomeribacter sp. 1016415]|nr:hypothetical protein [Glomeribacter sp. 1016415]